MTEKNGLANERVLSRASETGWLYQQKIAFHRMRILAVVFSGVVRTQSNIDIIIDCKTDFQTRYITLWKKSCCIFSLFSTLCST